MQKITQRKNWRMHKVKIKAHYLILISAFVLATTHATGVVEAIGCPSLRIIFARGSGGERNTDPNFLEYKSTIATKLKTTNLDYEFIDLDYPAVGVGIDNFKTTLGAYVGGGEAYEFGDSVESGVSSLVSLINNNCPNTKYVVGGYSQGAMVISKALPRLNANKIIYAATFGDPKIYLPEGAGLIPAACQGKNLSDYRMYVPDCQAHKGLLGAYTPYRPDSLAGKVGTWCNKRDIFCSSRFNISDHVSYISDHLYEDASRVIFDKITRTFGVKNTITSPHDTAILIDSSASMQDLLQGYKNEALRLAKETLSSGGRIALYDYRDLNDPYTPVERCNFETCTLEIFTNKLNEIEVDGGGDYKESLLSASFHVMKKLNWKLGSTKSLVILTDDGFLSPDRDGITMKDVVSLSKRIDPVNFYIITNDEHEAEYDVLAESTDGRVVTNFDELSLLTSYIMDRYDSLPRVEEEITHGELTLNIVDTARNSDDTFTVRFNHNGESALVILNDVILGTTKNTELVIGGLKGTEKNTLKLAPLANDWRGDTVSIDLDSYEIMPKAPNTGKLK